jgi:hypothetical protein
MNEVIYDFRFEICDLVPVAASRQSAAISWVSICGALTRTLTRRRYRDASHANRKSKIKNRKSHPSHSRDAEFPGVIPFALATASALCQIAL